MMDFFGYCVNLGMGVYLFFLNVFVLKLVKIKINLGIKRRIFLFESLYLFFFLNKRNFIFYISYLNLIIMFIINIKF